MNSNLKRLVRSWLLRVSALLRIATLLWVSTLLRETSLSSHNLEVDEDLTSVLALEGDVVPVAGGLLLEGLTELNLALTDQIRLSNTVNVNNRDGEVLLTRKLVSEGVLPGRVLSLVLGDGSLVLSSTDGDLNLRVHLSEGLGVVGESAREWSDEKGLSLHYVYILENH